MKKGMKKVNRADVAHLLDGWDPDVPANAPQPKRPAHEEFADIFGGGQAKQEPVKPQPVPVTSEYADIFEGWDPENSEPDGEP